MSSNSSLRLAFPDSFVLMFLAISLCAIATYILPAGMYERQLEIHDGVEREVVLPSSYHQLPGKGNWSDAVSLSAQTGTVHSRSILDTLTAIPRGMAQSADIIFFTFLCGGVIGILHRVGLITALISSLVNSSFCSPQALSVLIICSIAIGGSTFGLGEELVPLVPIFAALAGRLGYNALYGVALVFLGAEVGFASATTNPFSVVIAQSIAQVPLYSWMGIRIAFFVCALMLTCRYVLRYGAAMKKDSHSEQENADVEDTPMTGRLWLVLACSAGIYGGILYCAIFEGWTLQHMAGASLTIGLAASIIMRLTPNEAARAFAIGMQDITIAALLIGVARGIEVVLREGQILDTVIHGAATVLQMVPSYLAVQGMLFFQTMLNVLIPSGSGQAAVTMPLMAPLSDLVGISRQVAVLAFQFGDGIGNILIPTNSILIASLALAGVSFGKWFRFAFPLFLRLKLLAIGFLFYAHLVS